VDPDDVSVHRSHLGEVLLDHLPAGVPIVFEEPSVVVVVLFKARRGEAHTFLVDEVEAVRRDADSR